MVLLDGPLVFDLDRVMSGGLPFAFENDLSMRLGIVRRRDIPATRTRTRTRSPSGEREKPPSDDPVEVAWVDTGEPCFAYHVVNCYDDPADPDVVVIDACKADGTNALGMARGFDAGAKNGYAEPSEPSDSDDPRDSARSRQPPLGSHPNAVGLGRDVAAMWRWRVNARTGTLLSSARLSGEQGTARRALLSLRKRFGGSNAAAMAAFRLGRLSWDNDQDAGEAARWFRRYLSEAPRGALAADARGRLMVALRDSGQLGEARRVAKSYLSLHPQGSYANIATSLLGPKPR